MGWRTVIIENACKLSYKNDYMLVKAENDNTIYIPEIDSIIINTTQCVITAVLICELIKHKVNIIFCDEKHNPHSNLLAFSGCHNASKKIKQQIDWDSFNKCELFTRIVRQKILNQASLLKKKGFISSAKQLFDFASDVTFNDETNREGHAAKVYFNTLFGKNFTREGDNPINDALDYGYMIMLSAFNRSISSAGFLTQLGLKHSNEFNPFNLSCDLIEPFRVIVDEYVFDNPPNCNLTKDYKANLIALLQNKIEYHREYYLYDAISIYVRKITDALSNGDVENVKIYEF